MTADPLTGVSHVRRARRSSRVACGCYILTGSVIVKRRGQWSCLPCALRAIRAKSADSPAAAPAEETS